MTIDLSNKQVKQFQQLAESLSISPQELVRAAIDDFLLRQADKLMRALSLSEVIKLHEYVTNRLPGRVPIKSGSERREISARSQ